ncbi:MAG: AAA family ATPase [Candidatus Shikimatogenerans bostrichidophilus]|nr:MAG: AAA family ATPase [Candidatus Shikimatogenerans bostrichidophilus]
MKIILIGYMGSGKTYIGNLLSKIINYKFYDLDILISNIYNISLNNIFKLYGEKKFRIIENKVLKDFLFKKYNKSLILSVGGGTPCFFKNMYIMNKYSNTFYLKCKNNILYKRLLLDNKNRPILKNKIKKKKKLLNFIKKSIKKREKYYLKSKYKINTKKMIFVQIALHIKKILKINV